MKHLDKLIADLSADRQEKVGHHSNELIKTSIGHISSGNVYADIGVPDPQGMYDKSKIVMVMGAVMKRCRLTDKQSAKILGIEASGLAAIMRGHFSDIAESRLVGFLDRLEEYEHNR